MFEKKQNNLIPPDMSKLKVIVIDKKTRIYVPLDVDTEKARARYWSHREDKGLSRLESKQQAD